MKFQSSLKASNKDLTFYANQLTKLGPTGQEAFLKMAQAVTQAELPIRRSNKLLSELWVTMKNTARWQLTSSALHSFIGALQTAYGYSKDLDRSLNNIRTVSGKSAEEMKEFAEQANKAAKALSSTTTEYTDAALIYYQQGLSDKEVNERADATIKMANVTRDSAQVVSDQMTAIWNNFDDGSKSLEYYADVITKLGAETASSSAEIAQGLEKFAAVAETVGLSYEYATAALATVTATTRQSADVVGTAFKTLFARIQGLNLGETLDDGTTLNKYSEALNRVGISIFDQAGQLKDMNVILDEMGSKWQTLSKDQQVALAQTVAGTRQYTQLVALMDNWDFFGENVERAMNAEGSLERQAQIYAESWEAARDRVRASAEDIYDSIINPEMFIDLDDIIAPIFDRIADIIDAMGGMKGVLNSVGLIFTQIYGEKVAQALRNTAANVSILTGIEGKRLRVLQEQAVVESQSLDISLAGDNEKLRVKLQLMQEETKLKGELNKQEHTYSQETLNYINQELDTINLLKQAYIEKSEAQYNNSTMANNTWIEDIEYNITAIGDWKNKLQELENTQNQLYKKSSTKLSLVKDGAEFDATIVKMKNDLDNLITSHGQLKIASEQWARLSITQRENTTSLKEILQTTGLWKDEMDEWAASNYEKYFNELGLEIGDTNQKIELLRKAFITLGANPEALKNYETYLKSAKKTIFEATSAQKTYNKEYQKFLNKVQSGNLPKATNDWATKINTVSGALMGLNMGINSIKTLKNAFTSEDLEPIERFTQVLTGLTLLLPAVTALTKLWTSSVAVNTTVEILNTVANTKGVGVKKGAILANKQGTLTTILYTLATKNQTKATIKQAAAQGTLNKMIFAGLAPYLAVIAAIGAFIVIVDALTVSSKEAAKKIEESNKAYEEQKEKLDELNSSLEQVNNRMDELKEKGTLTIIEQEELNKLRAEQAMLEKQVELQEKITKASKEQQQKDYFDNYQKANKELLKGYTQTGAEHTFFNPINGESMFALDPHTFRVEAEKAIEEEFARTGNVAARDAQLLNIEKQVEEYEKNIEESRLKWASENLGNLQAMENQYLAMLESNPNFGDTEVGKQFLSDLNKARQNVAGDEYYSTYIAPLLESANLGIEEFKTIIATGEISDALAKELKYAGIAADDFVQYVQERLENAKTNLKDFGLKDTFVNEFVDGLTNEELEIFLSMDVKSYEDFQEFYKAFLDIKNSILTIDAKAAQAASVDALKTLGAREELSKEQINDLKSKFANIYDLSDFEDLSKLDQIKALEDAYKTTILNRSELIAQESQKLDELITKNQDIVDKINTRVSKSKDGIYTEEDAAIIQKCTAELEAQMDVLNDLENFEIDPIELEIVGLEATISKLATIDEAISLIGENCRVEADDVEALMMTIPELFQDAVVSTVDGSVQLSEAVVKAVIGAEQASAEAVRDYQAKQLQSRIDAYDATITLIESQANITQEQDYQTLLANLTNGNIEKEKAGEVAKAILTAKLRQFLSERSDSAKTASHVNQDQQKTADASEEAAATVSENYAIAFENIAENARIAFANAEKYANAFSSGESVNAVNKENISKLDRSKFKTAENIEFSWKYDDAAFSQYDLALDFLNKGLDFSKLDLSKLTDEDKKGLLESLGVSEYSKDRILENDDLFKLAASRSLSETFAEAGADISAYDIRSNNYGALFTQEGYDATQLEKDIKTIHYARGEDVLNLSRLYRDYGDGDSSKSGSGSKSSTKAQKEALERYHEITREIEYQEKVLDKLDTQIERTYGVQRLEAYKQKIEELTKLADLEQQKMAAAEGFTAIDLAEIQQLGLNPIIDAESKNITNYTQLLEQAQNEYLAKMESATEETQDAIQKEYDERIKALEAYEDSVDKYHEQVEKAAEALRQIEDTKLEEINVKVELILDIKDMKDAAREFSKAIVESFGDAITHGIESAELGEEGMFAELGLVDTYQKQSDELAALLDNANEYTDISAIVDSMKDLQGNVIASGEALLDWIETVETMLPDAIDAARERFDFFLNQLDHNQSILSTIKELIALQKGLSENNKEFEEFYELSQKAAEEQYDAAKANAELNKEWMDGAKEQLDQAEAALRGVAEDDPAYDTLKANRDALLEEFQSAQEAMLSSAKEAMDAAKEMFEAELKEAQRLFEDTLSNNMGLDYMQTRYDNLIDEEERYLDQVNTTYERIRWDSKLQAEIDKASSLVNIQKLQALKDEFKTRAANGKLSQYDLDILNAKYEMTQKQIALEEAQNNKSQVRLARDSQGNWSYQYTTDQEAIDKANQEYNDASQNYYNIAKDQVKEVTGEILDAWHECSEEIAAIWENEDLTYDEKSKRQEEITRHYKNIIVSLENEKKIAVDDMNEAGSQAVENYGNTYQDVIDSMDEKTFDFEGALDTYLGDIEQSWKDYDDRVSDVADSTGTTMDDLSETIDSVSESTDNCRDAGYDLADSMWDTLDAVRDLSEGYAEMTEEIMAAVRALEELARAQAREAEEAYNRTEDIDEGSDFDRSVDWAERMINAKYGSAEYNEARANRETKVRETGENYGVSTSQLDSWLSQVASGDMSMAELRRLIKDAQSFDTGGYTGDFNSSKLAFLHEKELVLNQEDTRNMLSAVSMIRAIGPALFKQIEAILDNSAIAGQNLMSSKLSAGLGEFTSSNGIVQQLDITAEFPNATDQNEIREAILGLANYATQFTNPR